MFRVLSRTMRLAVILLALVIGISCRKHTKHPNHLKDVHPAKKFNIVTQARKEGSMMVMMKGKDGSPGQNGGPGDPGPPGIRGPPGPVGLKGATGVCTKEQCESDELKALITRVLLLEKYVKDKQNQTRAAAATTTTITTTTTTTTTTKTPATTTTTTPGATARPPQPPKVTVSSSPPAPAQGQPALAPAAPPPQPPAAAVPSPAPAPPVAVQTSPSQVLWGNPAAPPVSVPLPSPFGDLTIESTVETPPGAILGNGNGHVDIQGVVMPGISVAQAYRGNPETLPGVSRGIPFKKSSILSKGAASKLNHVPQKSAQHSAVHHKTRTQKS